MVAGSPMAGVAVALTVLLTAAAPAAAELPRLREWQDGSRWQDADAAQQSRHHQNQQLLMDSDEALHFQVIGDWGRQGDWNQSDLADVMAQAARDAPPAFVMTTGDNFYPSGLTSVDDPNFDRSFRDVYHQPELQVPWLAVLGNHDYGDGVQPGDAPPACGRHTPPWVCSPGPLTQLAAQLAARDPRWDVRRARVLSLAGGAVDVFMYDTTPFVQMYYGDSWADNPGGIREQSWTANLVELEAQLAASRAGWKLVVGHHPVRSNGFEHGDTPELRELVEPLLERYGAQLYLAGHDHDLEHIHEGGRRTHHIVSGAGSQTRELAGDADALFQHPLQGFVAVTVQRDSLEAAFWGLEGPQPMYTASIPRADARNGAEIPAEAAGETEGGGAAEAEEAAEAKVAAEAEDAAAAAAAATRALELGLTIV